MVRFLLSGFVFLIGLAALQAQTLNPCGTAPHRSEWLASFQKGGIDLAQRAVDFRVAINAHLVGGDQSGLFKYGLMLESLAALERDYDSTGIGFVVNLPIDTLRSTQYYSHDDVLDGADMMFANNKENALNIYFLSNPAGNCGYNLPYAGIAMASQCSGLNQRTIAHEVGHALSLPHPFLGWEGGQTDDGSVPPDFTSPAPRTVTYNYTFFQDTLIRDTLIIDTANVELVARTNCYDAADGFCDTPADYIAQRWTCRSNGSAGIQQLDPDGVAFDSDGTLIMGYSDDACQARFSDEQKAAMQAFAQAERSSWVRPMFDTNRVRGFAEVELSADGYVLGGSELTFSAVENATHYFVEVSERRSFSRLLIDTVVTGLSVPLPLSVFEVDETYYVRIYAFNDHSFLAGMSPSSEFKIPVDVSSTPSILVSKIVVSPNPVVAGSTLELPHRKDITQVQWYDARGALVKQEVPATRDQVRVPAGFAAGVYNLMVVAKDGNRYTSRVHVLR